MNGPRDRRREIRRALVFAGAMVVVAVTARYLSALGFASAAEWARRLTMAATGAFLVMTGNALPKTLTPIAAMTCDGTRLQRFQRLAGWTWVLTGASLIATWLLLPLDRAAALTLPLVGAAVSLIAVTALRLRWSPGGPAIAGGGAEDQP